MNQPDPWHDAIERIKSVISRTELIETIKWGTEVYTMNGQNVLGIGRFKSHLAVWFYNGVFLKDERKLLVNAQEGKTKALRQWRFFATEDVNEQLLVEYIAEAIENEKLGRRWVKAKEDKFHVPSLLSEALRKDPELNEAFSKLTSFRQKEYAEYVEAPKREATKIERLNKIIPLIIQGVGLNDEYRNCKTKTSV